MSARTSSTTSTPGSPLRSGSVVRRAAVITHGKPVTIGPALERLEKVAREAGVELLLPDEEVEKHGVGEPEEDLTGADIAVVLGGDGTMLRALQRFLGTRVPVVGVNFGRVGFLASVQPNELESGLARVFSGDYRVVQLTTLDVEAGDARASAVNDVVVLSSIRGRMVELGWAVGGEDLGVQPCDGMICSTPSGSTAYNLSNGGPVLVRGLDAMAITFIAPHSLHVRPLVVPRGLDLEIRNRTPDVSASVLVDGHMLVEIDSDAPICVRLGEQRSLLAMLPEATFFRRYRETFGS
ncbi:MAG TPA: NAD(+)/NADH kinase [Gaiellaceae bacterium]|nr:NAD(+)/NADH kinase [Gaiellaceae bacterium]